jgi:hypothetical protein
VREESVPEDTRPLVYSFFYWFSRFEFALKEARILRTSKLGEAAMPGWGCYIERFEDAYKATEAGKALIEAAPQRQVVGDGDLPFIDLSFREDASDLEHVVCYAQAVRNNLFHGGKHGSVYWDDPVRTRHLLETVVRVLHELADVGGLSGDFCGEY